jgi:Ribosomal protein S16
MTSGRALRAESAVPTNSGGTICLCSARLLEQGAAKIKRVSLVIPRIKYWLSVGAQPSDTVGRLLGASGLLGRHPRAYTDSDQDTAAGSEVSGDVTSGAVPAQEVNAFDSAAPLSPTATASTRGLADALYDAAPSLPAVHDQMAK